MTRFWRRALAPGILLAALLAACGGGATGSGGGDTGLEPGDTDADEVLELDVLKDPGPGHDGDGGEALAADGDAVDASPETTCEAPYAGFLCSCTDDDDCASGTCVQTDTGRACSIPCQGACPAPGWVCAELPSTCPDCQYLCVFASAQICQPCATDDDCTLDAISAGARCVSYGGAGHFCAAPCAVDDDCPEAYACTEVGLAGGGKARQCLLRQGECACNPRSIEAGAVTDCELSNAAGTCAGTRQCAADGLTACDAPAPAPETCNLVDDDCDGFTDDGLAGQACDLSNEWGTCPGGTTCVDGVAGCGGVPAAKETCDGHDDDCDGVVDDGFADSDSDGQANCVDDDDDSDGIPDDGDGTSSPTDNPCLPGQGLVRRSLGEGGCDDNCTTVANPGQADLDKDGKGDACDKDADGDTYVGVQHESGNDCDDVDPAIHPGAPEGQAGAADCATCDGRDNDCDGLTDEACFDLDDDGTPDCLDADLDGDGLPNDLDNCPSLASADTADSDNDGQGDGCDADDDNDGVLDPSDNCRLVANADQAACDADGLGNACDADDDGDEVPDSADCEPCNPYIHAGAVDGCNAFDDDCDGQEDEDCAFYLGGATFGSGFARRATGASYRLGHVLGTTTTPGESANGLFRLRSGLDSGVQP